MTFSSTGKPTRYEDKAVVDRSCEWLKNNVPNKCDGTVWGNFIDEFREYMGD